MSVCGAVTGVGADFACELPAGHNSPHENNDQDCRMTWEPLYVADLRRELEDARDALRWAKADLAEAEVLAEAKVCAHCSRTVPVSAHALSCEAASDLRASKARER